jgi:hypothetical protein
MRAVLAVSLIALLCPATAMAQSQAAPTPAAPSAATAPAAPAAAAHPAPRRGGDITRDQYVERAKDNAGRRFDRMDADHDGVLTEAERRAWREAHHRHRAPPSH